ncbi:MAG: hypothetical protein HYZ15_05325 [Sphingobacteriales bacterium]|nr:hypothetical protein [Sphingobacteriales bacterium]
MSKIISIALLLISISSIAQDKYQYYFIEMRNTGKGEVEVEPENQVVYDDIDSLLVTSREMNKRGIEEVKGRKYGSYTEVFNRLSREGLEFVQFANLGSFGGATAMLAGDIRINYLIWRRKVNE